MKNGNTTISIQGIALQVLNLVSTIVTRLTCQKRGNTRIPPIPLVEGNESTYKFFIEITQPRQWAVTRTTAFLGN